MNTSETLHKAADAIQEHGWGTGPNSMLGAGGVCIMGAIHVAIFGEFGEDYLSVNSCPAGRAVTAYLELDRDDPDAMWDWNDQYRHKGGEHYPAHTAEEVVEVLRAVAVIEASREKIEALA